MKKDFVELAYKYYPRGIRFFDSKRNVSSNYIESPEFKNLEEKRRILLDNKDQIFNNVKRLINDGQFHLELREISNILSGDRSLSIQHSGFFQEEKKKYYPIIISVSGIIPFFTVYVNDIDISIDETTRLGAYKWTKNNGVIMSNSHIPEIKNLVNEICMRITSKTEYKEFPESRIREVIPDIENSNIEFGNFTLFNAFFLDDFFCFP